MRVGRPISGPWQLSRQEMTLIRISEHCRAGKTGLDSSNIALFNFCHIYVHISYHF